MTDTRPEALRRLDPLVGRWEVITSLGPITGTVTFEWQDGAFLVQRSTAPDPIPNATVVIGVDDTTDECTALYYDNRGVHRIYRMSLVDGEWRQWRDAPGFAQRLTGRFEDPDTIQAAWEKCLDGETWEHDFDLTYRRQS